VNTPNCDLSCPIRDQQTTWGNACGICQRIDDENEKGKRFHLLPIQSLTDILSASDDEERWARLWFALYSAERQFRRYKKKAKRKQRR